MIAALRRVRSVVSIAVLAGAAASAPPRAEVGMAVPDEAKGPDRGTGGYMWSITDDPEPFNGSWLCVLPPDQRRHLQLNCDGAKRGDGPPSMLRVPVSGLTAVAWSRRRTGGDYDVVISVFRSGAWTAPTVVAGSSEAELDPFLVAEPDGAVHLLYWVDAGAESYVVERKAPADLSGWSEPFPISEPGGQASRPAGAIVGDALLVSYERGYPGSVPGGTDVMLAEVHTGTVDRAVVATVAGASALWPRVHAERGHLWVDWIASAAPAGYPGTMAWSVRDAKGGFSTPSLVAFTSEVVRDFHVRGRIRAIVLDHIAW